MAPSSKNASFSRSEITELFKNAKTSVKEHGIEIRRATTASGRGRLLVVTPKYIGNAPKRNKVRRRLKSLFRELELAQHNKDTIVLVRPQGVSLPFDTLHSLLLKAFVS